MVQTGFGTPDASDCLQANSSKSSIYFDESTDLNLFLSTFLACTIHAPTGTNAPQAALTAAPLATVTRVEQLSAMACDDTGCTLSGADGIHRYDLGNGTLTPTEGEVDPAVDAWPVASEQPSMEEQWNEQVRNRWRSPFRREIPSPNGGRLRNVRGLTPGTSRVVRIGGSVVTARQGLDADAIAYPNVLALHPTGAEAYLIVWPNPDLIAFRAQTLKTTWRIRLGAPALGLFVSADGRYLLAETDGTSPEHQLLDYEPTPRTAPSDTDPAADPTLAWLERPEAKGTILVDLTIGEVVARLPGPAVGFYLLKDGAVVGSHGGVAVVRRPKEE